MMPCPITPHHRVTVVQAERCAAPPEPGDQSLAFALLLGLLPVGSHRLVQRLGDGAVSLRCGVLVDQGGLRRVVPHPSHQVPGARSVRGEGVAGVPQVVEVQIRLSDAGNERWPSRR